MDPVTTPERARRLARVLVSDVAAYAGDQVRIGLEKDDLFERLAPEIARARTWYLHHVDPSVAERVRLFDFALVDVLVYRNRRVQTHIW
ncbi:MAG TPA: hypothetical protein VMR86_18620 [Myxococcota bacterium]|nr:hypothetical protein [Myxococcota bacterium]